MCISAPCPLCALAGCSASIRISLSRALTRTQTSLLLGRCGLGAQPQYPRARRCASPQVLDSTHTNLHLSQATFATIPTPSLAHRESRTAARYPLRCRHTRSPRACNTCDALLHCPPLELRASSVAGSSAPAATDSKPAVTPPVLFSSSSSSSSSTACHPSTSAPFDAAERQNARPHLTSTTHHPRDRRRMRSGSAHGQALAAAAFAHQSERSWDSLRKIWSTRSLFTSLTRGRAD